MWLFLTRLSNRLVCYGIHGSPRLGDSIREVSTVCIRKCFFFFFMSRRPVHASTRCGMRASSMLTINKNNPDWWLPQLGRIPDPDHLLQGDDPALPPRDQRRPKVVPLVHLLHPVRRGRFGHRHLHLLHLCLLAHREVLQPLVPSHNRFMRRPPGNVPGHGGVGRHHRRLDHFHPGTHDLDAADLQEQEDWTSRLVLHWLRVSSSSHAKVPSSFQLCDSD